MKIRIYFYILLIIIFSSTACASKDPKASSEGSPKQIEILVSAAASLTDALNEIKLSFEKENPGTVVNFNFASSGKLAKQIEQGAPSDLFLSASKKDMDSLVGKQLIVGDSRVDFAHNQLVLITQKESPLSSSTLNTINLDEIEHFAIGEPEIVPAGRYAKQALESLQLWEPLQGKLVFGSDVRQVLTYVESGNANLGLVYSSDALTTNKVKVLTQLNSDMHEPIVYPGAIVSQSLHKEEAEAFLNYLTGSKGKEILNKFGFEQ